LPFQWLEMRAGAVETEKSSNALVCFRALFNFLSPKLYCGTVVVLSCLRGKLLSLHVDYTLCVVRFEPSLSCLPAVASAMLCGNGISCFLLRDEYKKNGFYFVDLNLTEREKT
jgi:hypothetical protein